MMANHFTPQDMESMVQAATQATKDIRHPSSRSPSQHEPPSTAQTVAQAVQAATQAQQVASPPLHAPSLHSGSTIDNLTCQWQGCGERCDTAESLYDHVCERHVGRKSTNNLNLTCQWGSCRTTTVKRDHITSHIRVHVPLKPHKCDFCGKAFKRPQDLKKHVKTHADDSVLIGSPHQGQNGRNSLGGTGTLGQQNGKTFSSAGSYFGNNDSGITNPYPSYQPAMGNGANGSGYPQPNGNGQYAGYGSVSYPNSTAMQDLQSLDTRRRAIEALNDFLGDIKRRAIDPGNYYDVGQRLQSNTLPLPVGSGYNTGYNVGPGQSNYNTASLLDSFTNGGGVSSGGGMHGGIQTQNYQLPLPNARSKNDLQDIDRFLEQLQATVYETSSHAVVHPGVHNSFPDFNFSQNNHNHYRDTGSPSSIGDSSMGGANAIGSLPNMTGVSQPGVVTPALTPASVSSVDSAAHSPMSNHSRTSIGNMYPTVPSVPSASHIGTEYSNSTSANPGNLAYTNINSRRFSGQLNRQNPQQDTDTDMLDLDDGSHTPKAMEQSPLGSNKGHSSIDPALQPDHDQTPSDSESTPAGGVEDSSQEQWVENIRVIEALRKWVSDRLKNGEFENTESSPQGEIASTAADEMTEDHEDRDDSKSIAIAKMVEAKMANADSEHGGVDVGDAGDVKYPILPSA